jgi:hypothetical protein
MLLGRRRGRHRWGKAFGSELMEKLYRTILSVRPHGVGDFDCETCNVAPLAVYIS